MLWGAYASPRVVFGVSPNTVLRRDAANGTRGRAAVSRVPRQRGLAVRSPEPSRRGALRRNADLSKTISSARGRFHLVFANGLEQKSINREWTRMEGIEKWCYGA
jgi:hypothetical protein